MYKMSYFAWLAWSDPNLNICTGHVRVNVTPEKVNVEYIRSYLPKDAITEHPNGEIEFSCEIAAARSKSEWSQVRPRDIMRWMEANI